MTQGTQRCRWSARLVTGLAVLVVWASPLLAQEAPKSTMQGEHVVRPGDTLWDLARQYLQNPFLWGLIYEANRGTVANPHWIYPNERLRIPGLPSMEAPPSAEAPLAEVAAPPARTRFYVSRPEEPDSPQRLGDDPAEEAVVGVRAEEFHSAPWIAERSELPLIGELISVVGQETSERIPRTVFPNDRVYLRYLGERTPEVAELLLLVREDESVRGMGRVIRPTAIVRVTRLAEEVYEAVVVEQFDRARTGDRAVIMEPFPGPVGTASRPVVEGPRGQLIAFFDDPLLPRDRSIGFIDLGTEDGIGFGDELVAYLPERRAGGGYDELLPPEPVARLRVIRVRERSATVRVVHLELPSLETGLPVHLVATP